MTLNDSGDGDAGANNLQNFPLITNVAVGGGNTTVTGTLNSLANTNFRLEFFASPAIDPSGNGEGQVYLGFLNVTTNGAGNLAAPFSFVKSGYTLPAGWVITATATVSNVGFTTFTDTSEFSPAVGMQSISGTIYNDVNADANVTNDSGAVFANATVKLYLDNGNGQIDAGDVLIATTTTNPSGAYIFNGLGNGTYYVVVDSKTLSAAGYNGTSGIGDVWAEETYAAAGAATGLSTFTTSAGALYGGKGANVSDEASALTTAEHVNKVTVAGANASGIDSGYSFNVVTNVRGGDATDDDGAANRTVQGSLRQFIQNADAITGANLMRFVPGQGVATVSGSGQTWWQLTVSAALPQITDALTTIDGTAYSFTDGTTVLNPNNASIGYSGQVGLGADAIAGTADDPTISFVNGPELEIAGSAGVPVGLDLQANNITVQRIDIHGFRNTGDLLTEADIRVGIATGTDVGVNLTGIVIQDSVIGTGPASLPARLQETAARTELESTDPMAASSDAMQLASKTSSESCSATTRTAGRFKAMTSNRTRRSASDRTTSTSATSPVAPRSSAIASSVPTGEASTRTVAMAAT